MKSRKGILLAGGTGSRLFPITNCMSKQLLPVFDKPMIFYPITTLMEADIRNILIISSKEYLPLYKKLLGSGDKLGLEIDYLIQEEPLGIAHAILIGSSFLQDSPATLILGDNLFFGENLNQKLTKSNLNFNRSTIFSYEVKDPNRYGVVSYDSENKVIDIEEKPTNPKSNAAVTGLYFYDENVVEKAKMLNPSERGELEITDLNNIYIKEGLMDVEQMGPGSAWFDTGTFESLHEASAFIRSMQSRQLLKIGCPEETAWRKNWINDEELYKLALPTIKSGYGSYLLSLLGK
ncbi:MAG: glucose-1-phosphate thymidylyltransferase RfbA [Prochlorococcus marinus XMU1428]|nr:glucose-1-phosphate thymidylyltransferase RfbA [Prochlorococcus marinus XMU1428]